MSVNKIFENAWYASGFKKPEVFLGFYKGNIYATIDDSGQLFRFVSKSKNNKQPIIYVVVRSKCKKNTTDDGVNLWVINDTNYDIELNKNALQVISCGKEDPSMIPSDNFVRNTLASLIPDY